MKKYINPQSRTIKLEMENVVLVPSNPETVNMGISSTILESESDAETRRLVFDEDDDW